LYILVVNRQDSKANLTTAMNTITARPWRRLNASNTRTWSKCIPTKYGYVSEM